MSQLAHMFDLKRLQAFITVVEEGSITAASQRLGVAQPALSASIRRLEADLAVTLLERLPRGIKPTQAGKDLLPRIYEVFSILSAIEENLVGMEREPSGELSIGLPPSTSAVLTQPLLKDLSTRFPKVSLRLVEAMSGYLQNWIADGELDVAVTFNSQTTDSIVSTPLMREEMMLIGAIDEMKSLPSPFPFERLAELPLIATSGRHRLRSELEDRLEHRGLKPNIKFEIDAGHELVRLVSSGVGYGVFARSAFYDELAAERVKAVPLEPGYTRTVCLSYHRRKSLDPAFAKVIGEIKRLAAKLMETGQWPASQI